METTSQLNECTHVICDTRSSLSLFSFDFILSCHVIVINKPLETVTHFPTLINCKQNYDSCKISIVIVVCCFSRMVSLHNIRYRCCLSRWPEALHCGRWTDFCSTAHYSCIKGNKCILIHSSDVTFDSLPK